MIQTYGQINGYLLPILTMPAFLTITLSNLLLPSFTYHYSRHNYKRAKILFLTISLCCFFVGILCSSICFFYPEQLLRLFYHNETGADALKLLSIPFAFYSLQPCLSSLLHALSLSKKSVFDTFAGCLIRLFHHWLLFLYISRKRIIFRFVCRHACHYVHACNSYVLPLRG